MSARDALDGLGAAIDAIRDGNTVRNAVFDCCRIFETELTDVARQTLDALIAALPRFTGLLLDYAEKQLVPVGNKPIVSGQPIISGSGEHRALICPCAQIGRDLNLII